VNDLTGIKYLCLFLCNDSPNEIHKKWVDWERGTELGIWDLMTLSQLLCMVPRMILEYD